jgi:hypothetical protein
VILAHFTGSDGPSTALVLGLALTVLGVRKSRRSWLAAGVVLLAVGLVAGIR